MRLSPLLPLIFSCLSLAVTAPAQIVINEGSNRNYQLLPDEDGEYPDWVELYNAGNEPVNLLNHSITDKLNNPDKWVFPEVLLQPGQFITVFCSDKDRIPTPGFTPVVNNTPFSPLPGWNTHYFSTPFYWDGTSSILINTCSYSGVGYTSNSVFAQSATSYLSTIYAVQDGAPDVCSAGFGTPVFQRPDLKINGIQIGNGELQNSPTSYPAPYGNWYWCARHQMLIPAAELTASGLQAGFINSLAFRVLSTDPNTVYDYIDIQMKLTSETSLSNQFGSNEASTSLHTNFKISEDGETIYLFSPTQFQLSSLHVNCQDLDVTRGRYPDASNTLKLFATGTPAASNNTSAPFSSTLIPLSFSVPPGQYQTSFTVTINNPNGAGSEVRYTRDGSDPTTDSPLYNGEPLFIPGTTVLKARAFSNSALPGPLEAASYLFGISHTTPVLSVITDNNNLYGATGIFDNWWTDWERAAYADYFDSTGQLVFSQRSGMQVDGGWGGSRFHPQHSFRLEPGDGVLGDGPINYPLIPDRPQRTKYSKFYLRNGSNQYLILPYKDAAQVTSMSKGTYNYYSAWRPVSVYINGGYFGLYEMREKMDAEYFETLENADEDDITILSQSAWYGGTLRAVEGAIEPFYTSVQLFNALDPASPAYWNQASQLFDLTWYTDYIIGESWMGNTDWPWNNIKIYRSDKTGLSWRYCLIDQELAMQPNGWTDCYFDHIRFLLDQDPTIPHIAVWLKSMQNNRYHDYFINRFADQMNTVYLTEKITAVEQQMFSLTHGEMANEYMRWGDPNNLQGQMMAFTGNHITLQQQLQLRTEQVRNHLQSNFGLAGQVDLTLNVLPAGAGRIRVSTVTPDTYPWQGIYFNGIPVSIEAQPDPGYYFSHWVSNGLISDTLNALFSDTLNASPADFTAIFGEEHVGTEQSEKESYYHLYPNPAGDLLWLNGPVQAGSTYRISGLNGQLIQTGEVNASGRSTCIALGSLPPAMYLLTIQNPLLSPVQLKFIRHRESRE